MNLVVLYAEFASKTHLGYGHMAGLGVLILTPPTVCLLVAASYLLVRGWATVDAVLAARAAGTRLLPGAAFRDARTSRITWHTSLLVAAIVVAVWMTAVHPAWLVLHPLTSRLVETAGPVLLTTFTFQRMTRVRPLSAAVALAVTLFVAVVVSVLTVTMDRLPPAQPMMTTITVLLMVGVTAFVQTFAAARASSDPRQDG